MAGSEKSGAFSSSESNGKTFALPHGPDDLPASRSIVLSYRYTVNAPRSFVWAYLIELEKIYSQTSPAHKHFRVVEGGPISASSVIECGEVVDGEHAEHVYHVNRYEPDTALHYVSPDSVTTMPDGKKFKSSVYCSFDLTDAGTTGTDLTQIDFAVIIVLPNRMYRFFAKLMGTVTTWQPHIVEESLSFARIVDRAFFDQQARNNRN
ncbi:MAG: SRPBCC family protein [Hyphomicrobiales bacterium]